MNRLMGLPDSKYIMHKIYNKYVRRFENKGFNRDTIYNYDTPTSMEGELGIAAKVAHDPLHNQVTIEITLHITSG